MDGGDPVLCQPIATLEISRSSRELASKMFDEN